LEDEESADPRGPLFRFLLADPDSQESKKWTAGVNVRSVGNRELDFDSTGIETKQHWPVAK
jgi:hypothetical protein